MPKPGKNRLDTLLDNATEFRLKEILQRLRTQESFDIPSAEVVQKCLKEVKVIEAGRRNSAADEKLIQQIITLAQKLLTSMGNGSSKTPAAAGTPVKASLHHLPDFITLSNLTEAKVSEDGSEFDATLIVEGWSDNGRYYSAEVIESMPGLMQSHSSGKMYLNHLMTKAEQQAGRKMENWAAQIISTKVVENAQGKKELQARIHVFDEPHGWLKERIAKFPGEVGISISAYARMQEGEADGKKGWLVSEIKFLESFDIVDRAAAGGKVMRVAAGLDLLAFAQSLEMDDDGDDTEPPAASTTTENLQSFLKKQDGDHKMWELESALRSALREIANSTEAFPDENSKQVGYAQILDEFKTMMLAMPITDILKNAVYEVSVTYHKEGDTDVDLKELTVETLEKERPDLMDAIKEAVIEDQDAEASLQKERDQHKKTQEKLDAALGENKTLKTEAKLRERKELVEQKLAEAKLPELVVDEAFKSDLINAADEAEIDARIKRQHDLVEKVTKAVEKPKVHGNSADDAQPPLDTDADDDNGEPTTEKKDPDTSAEGDDKIFSQARTRR